MAEKERTQLDNSLYQTIIDLAAPGFLAIDLRSNILEANGSYCTMSGYTREELLEKDLFAVRVEPPESVEKDIANVVQMGGLYHESFHRRKDGHIYPVESSLTYLGVHGIIAVFVRDITQRRKMERFREDQMSLLAHDLRTPLTVILSWNDLLKRAQHLLPASLHNAVMAIEINCERIKIMIEELYLHSKLNTPAFNIGYYPVELNSLIKEMITKEIPPHEQARIKVSFTQSKLSVMGDASYLKRAMLNLMTNALKYSPADTTVKTRLIRRRHQAIICVRDEGLGINPEDAPRIFEKHYRTRTAMTKRPGLGLGLYGVKLIIEAHKGDITIKSEPGHGSTFCICLPLIHHNESG